MLFVSTNVIRSFYILTLILLPLGDCLLINDDSFVRCKKPNLQRQKRHSLLASEKYGAPSLYGGGDTTTSSTRSSMSMSDYSGTARTLFGNVISPAALLAGALVPLGFLAEPLPAKNKKLRCLYYFLAVASLGNELLAISYAMVASNKLIEVSITEPVSSVFHLIQRDYELQWVATNVHFLFGLLGFMFMIMLRAYTIYPKQLNIASAGLAGSILLMMISVLNRGISKGDGRGNFFGGSIISLLGRYITLLARQIQKKAGFLEVASIALGIVSSILALRALSSPESQ